MHHEIHDNQLYLQRLAEEKEHLTNDFDSYGCGSGELGIGLERLIDRCSTMYPSRAR